ncbi:hypothetical protein QFZ77_004453 [Paenibacillus sp. V4I3]|uniref:CBO0543 family protein n=1 Tax=Paenibacillus sp. V4I3 TaxID=3042305 RepID=UPI0027860E6A|nr:hypothetical protein [Paenibacillus sp. V4I3]
MYNQIIQWSVFVLSLISLLIILKKSLIGDCLYVYLITVFFSSFIPVILIEQHYYEHPVRFLSQYFSSAVLFDYLAFPTLNVLFNLTTKRSKLVGVLAQAVLYSALMTTVEFILERYTELIKYYSWTWMHSFVTLIAFFLFVRLLMSLIRTADERERSRGVG